VIRTSGADMHPATGARFVFEREPGEPPRYRVQVYLPEARKLECTVAWDDASVRLEPVPDDAWVAAEIAKLARVLHRDPKSRLTRWRGP
jgi:hypothetical protein